MNRKNPIMKVGDRVTWESQSLGYVSRKHGVVVAVVPQSVMPQRVVPEGFILYKPGQRRDHESYLVQVDGKGKRLYWPKVHLLELDRRAKEA